MCFKGDDRVTDDRDLHDPFPDKSAIVLKIAVALHMNITRSASASPDSDDS
jgi:hypothetical protein